MVTKGVPYGECQRVPWIFTGPGVTKGRNGSTVCNGSDLLPTLCELAGIEAPECDGVSIAAKVTGKDKKADTARVLYTEGDGFVNVSDGRYKYTLFDGANGAEMLVDLRNDNGELTNIIAQHPEIARKLKEAVPQNLYRIQSKYLKKQKEGKVTANGSQSKEEKQAARKAAKKEARKAMKKGAKGKGL